MTPARPQLLVDEPRVLPPPPPPPALTPATDLSRFRRLPPITLFSGGLQIPSQRLPLPPGAGCCDYYTLAAPAPARYAYMGCCGRSGRMADAFSW